MSDLLSNSEKTKAIIDVMIIMNDNMRSPASGVNVCIFNAFGHTADQRKDRCAKYGGCCATCIAALVDEEG
jgi:hypothetical protein